jgi:hypothetical protein
MPRPRLLRPRTSRPTRPALSLALLAVLGCDEERAPLGPAALGPMLSVSPPALAFGAFDVGDGSADEVVVRNGGSAVVTVGLISFEGEGRRSFSARPNEVIKIAGGRSQRITVTFTPERGGMLEAEMVLFVDGSNAEPIRVPVSGIGRACVDLDRDGFGEGCVPGPDCDDGDDSRHPGAMELCNGEDDDCDREVDEGLATTAYWRDVDQDGYGDPSTMVLACAPPAGHVTRAEDCNDAEGREFPGNTEVCTGGLDEDCDGKIDMLDEDCVVPVPTCTNHDDCGLNANRSACPRIGAPMERCAPVCRSQADCTGGEACRPLPGSASLGFCQAGAGPTAIGGACSTAADCADGICVQSACRAICQKQADCGAGDVCGVALYDTRELGGAPARRLTTVCRPFGARRDFTGTCNLDAQNVDTGLCASEHCDLPPWSAQVQPGARCAPMCTSSQHCGAGQVCGLVYNGLAETPNLPPTGESAGRYYEAVLGCYTPYFRLNAATWQHHPPGTGNLGAVCDPNQADGRLACRNHLCAQFAPIRGRCTDFCEQDTDCVTPTTPDWKCRFGELSLTGIFLQSYDVADITRFVMIGVCAP